MKSVLNDRVIVKRLDAPEKSKGGIFLPDSAKERFEAKVLFVGPGALHDGVRVPMQVKKGDKVLLGKWSGQEITLDGEDALAVREDDIIGVL